MYKEAKMDEPQHVLQVLREAKEAVRQENNVKLKELSNQTIHSASIHQDVDCIMVAVIIYSLSKILERKHYQDFRGWNRFFSIYVKLMDKAINALKNNDIREFRKNIIQVRKEINRLSGHLKNYIKDVFRKASINKASRVYEHGISMTRTAKLLGISLWELAEYAGQTGIGDVDFGVTLPVGKRIKIAVDMFK